MNTHSDSVLRSLDVATTTRTAEEQVRGRAALEWILAAEPIGDPLPPRRSRRPALLAMAALIPAVAVVLIPGFNGDDAAYASWTAVPSSVTGDELELATSACREMLPGSAIDPDLARIVLAERRGDHVALLFRTEDPDLSGGCLAHNPPGTEDVDTVDLGVGGSSGPAQTAPATGFTQGAIFEHGGPAVSMTDGAVGTAVTGVTIHAGTLEVRASVQNGRYAAWWPGPAFRSGPPQPSGEGGPEPILRYDLTLTDGSVVHDARPTLPK